MMAAQVAQLENYNNTPNVSNDNEPELNNVSRNESRHNSQHVVSKYSKVRINSAKPLGTGLRGTVYTGLNEETSEIIAVKILKLDSEQKTSIAVREISLMKRFNHPNIVKYLGAERSGSEVRIYMEYISGGSLAEQIECYGVCTEEMCHEYCKQLIGALNYLHSMNVAHRNLNCSNILVEKTGDVKLADFGQAKDVEQIRKTLTGITYFMAPEVIEGRDYTVQADIWSFGCTVLEMLTGNPPFKRFTAWAAMYHIVNDNVNDEIPSNFSDCTKSFISYCLIKDPSVRPTSQQLMNHEFLKTADIQTVGRNSPSANVNSPTKVTPLPPLHPHSSFRIFNIKNTNRDELNNNSPQRRVSADNNTTDNRQSVLVSKIRDISRTTHTTSLNGSIKKKRHPIELSSTPQLNGSLNTDSSPIRRLSPISKLKQ